MGDSADVILNCPLCCNETFSSKELLAEHLSSTTGNLFCPICNNKFSSIAQLIEHLSHKNCPETENSQVTTLTIALEHENNELQDSKYPHCVQNDKFNNSHNTLLSGQNLDATEESDVNNMYVEIMKNQSQDMEFLKDGDNQYVIISQDHEGIVTKQNNDGTISLTSVKDMKLEAADPMISGAKQETDDNQEGLYSCNTCGVSFTSVIEHIQMYHNDQDVVVEEPMDENENEQIPIEYEAPENEESSTEKQTPRRVITETGDIVEAPLDIKIKSEVISTGKQKLQDKMTGPGSKRYMRMNNLCDSVVRDLKTDQKSSGPEHKVLVKEVMTKDGDCIKMYHCIFCNVYVNALSDFKEHPCKNSKYSCLQCPVKYDNAKSLCAHMKVHKVKTDGNNEVTETYECEICCTVFPTNKSLKLHKRMHDPVKARQIEAPRNSDFSEMRYLCHVCEKMIPIDYQKIHENSHKNQEKMLNCGICNKKFTSEEYLEMHMNVHNLDKAPLSKQDPALPYSCIYCDRRFARPHEKVKHERIHTGEKPHECEICGKSFRVSYCLTLHMRTHTGARPYGCPHCGKRFKAHSVYNHHLLTHSEVRAYKCPYCPKAFKTSVQLAGHKNSHTKPFSCTHCNRPFASLYAVRVHTETHARQNNLKFSCELCGASYARAFALKDHMKQVHQTDVKTEILVSSQEDWSERGTDASDVAIKQQQSDINKDMEEETSPLEIPSDEFIVPN